MNQEIYEELLFARALITDTTDFESRFEDILTMVIPPWIINPYGDIEETNVIIQEELTELSTNEEFKVQFKNGYQQFWLQNNIPATYPIYAAIIMSLMSVYQDSCGKLLVQFDIIVPSWSDVCSNKARNGSRHIFILLESPRLASGKRQRTSRNDF
ncbi:unnamed protein product [Acanthoscelides obtectus]|uniref:Uncharacterized protein n=1 Tax=Acanthoscelides obtectus TaxID=200917 RepID=A0A9P0PX13_ACAOB|nr:unnamed protein product [Acanthoscelides obtectus]CAK1620529.1 hypothetical protein AOBTE_LOCUS427 [Acanthoscelides obtectus]